MRGLLEPSPPSSLGGEGRVRGAVALLHMAKNPFTQPSPPTMSEERAEEDQLLARGSVTMNPEPSAAIVS